MKKICFITTSRADFGTLNELIKECFKQNIGTARFNLFMNTVLAPNPIFTVSREKYKLCVKILFELNLEKGKFKK